MYRRRLCASLTVLLLCGGACSSQKALAPRAATSVTRPNPQPSATSSFPAAVTALTTPGAVGRASAQGASWTLADIAALAGSFDGQDALNTVRTLSQPSFMGRHTGAPGEPAAAQYLADAFMKAGLKPAAGGTFLQAFPVTVEELSGIPVLELQSGSAVSQQLRLRDDFRPLYGGTAGAADVTGPALFVGSGSDLSGLDVEGKILLLVPRSSATEITTRARDAGALAVILTTGSETLLKGEGQAPGPDAIPVLEVSQSGSAALLTGSGHTRDELNADIQAGRPLPSFPLAWNIHIAVSLRPPARVDAHNVLGLLPGKNGATRTIVIGAHYEEIGPDPDGAVYPAANDNASGVSVLLELARLLHSANVQPEANIVFAAWSGHEEGLLGSSYYLNHPILPAEQTALYLNIDTVGQGTGQSLAAYASDQAANSALREALDLLQSYHVAAPVQSLGSADGLSDDASFSRSGIPALALNWSGINEGKGGIHTLDDTVAAVDPSKLQTTGRVATAVLLLAARR